MNDNLKIHLGSGSRILKGWLNIDGWEGHPSLKPEEYLRHDLRNPLPFDACSIEYIYSEHFIEHLDRSEGERMFKEIFRVLKSGGVMRVSTPNLAEIVDAYIKKDVKRFSQSWHPASPAQLLNEGLTSWGHKFTYDEAEMTDLLQKSGFIEVISCEWGLSKHEPFVDVDHRPRQNDLIIEAKKP